MTRINTKIAQWTLKGLIWLQAQGWISADRTNQVLHDLPIDQRTIQALLVRAQVATPPDHPTRFHGRK